MIGLVTDSTSQIPANLADEFSVEVVPVIVRLDGDEYAEGVELDADEFYRRLAIGVDSVETSQPSPGAFIDAYQRLAGRGATEILSVHVGADFSGTINSARLAAESIDIPVRIVDTGIASFGVTCCLWEAADAIADGAGLEEAAARAESLAPQLNSVFIVQALDFAKEGGRYLDRLDGASAIPILETRGSDFQVVGEGTVVADLVAQMVERMHEGGARIRAAVCTADKGTEPFAAQMREMLAARDDVVDLVDYRVGPSIGAHTGPGTAGGFWYRLD